MPSLTPLSILGPCLIVASMVTVDARAATSASFQAQAILQAGCAVDGLGSSGDAGQVGILDFGNDSALSVATHSASVPSTQSITLRCTQGVSLRMQLDAGQHAVTTVRNLQLGSSGNRISYQLYQDPGFTQPIGVNQDYPITVTATNMNNVRIPVYGRLTLPGNRPTGIYTDTVLITLAW